MAMTEAPAQASVILTDEAVRQAKRMIQQQETPGAFLRLGVMGGGCSGYSYVMRVDTEQSGRDQAFDFDGLKVVIDRKSLVYLAGTTLEYTGNLMTGGFEFRNPNAVKSCGCGVSFTV